MLKVESEGATIAAHHLTPSGDAPTLVICHATGFHGRAYQPFADHLRGHFDVWAVDFRGHGASTAPADGSFSWRKMAGDLLTCLDALGRGPIVAVGHSLGGAVILLAEQARPGSIAAAWLYEPVVFPQHHLDNRAENPMAEPARRRRADFDSRQEVIERYGGRPPLDRLDPACLAAYVEHGFVDTADGRVTLACRPEHEARVFEAEEAVTVEQLAGLPLRVTIAAGRLPADSAPSPAALAAPLADVLPNAVLEPWPHLGHFGPLEDPAGSARAVSMAFDGDDRSNASRG